jgi:replicative DNA helicase
MLAEARSRNIVSRTEPLEHMRWAERPPNTIPTPFDEWTRACRDEAGGQGVAMGWYVVIGGDTKQGKTLLALQCLGTALMAGRSIGFVNLEMSIPQLRIRVYSQLTGIPAYRIEPGPGYSAHHAKEVDDWIQEAQQAGVHRKFLVNEEPWLRLPDMIAMMEHWAEVEGCEVFCVDYMQLVEADTAGGIAGETREISKALRSFKQRHNCVVFAISQFNNEGGNASDNPPHAGSLYGGRRIAQDSDQTLLLDHSRTEKTDDGKTRTWLLMPYNRHGPSVEIPIEWDWTTLKATAAKPDEERLWPGAE